VAKDITEVCDILVSTDDPRIAEISKEAGGYVPWLRPKNLATDTASSVDVAIHALNWYEANKGSVDGVLLLQPTSPFRNLQSIRSGIDLFKKNEFIAVIGVSKCHAHPMWVLKMKGNFLVPFIEHHGIELRSQDLPLAYEPNGSFYLFSPNQLRTKKSFFGEKTIPLLIESERESLDIDTDFDFRFAEFVEMNN
jgi:N-acylneuraminate cytidylyltransferase